MKYKFIASDFDGTLLHSDDTISRRTVEAIRRYTEAGGIFAVSTGRAYYSLQPRLKELELSGGREYPIITFQGSITSSHPSGEHRTVIPLDNETVLKALEFAKDTNAYCQLYTVDELLIAEKCRMSDVYCSYNRIHDFARYVGDLSGYVRKTNPQILKLVYLDSAEKLEEINKRIKGQLAQSLSSFLLDPQFMECVSPLSGKGRAVLAAAAGYGIAPSGVIAIGDTMNDYTMIKDAGLGIAVKNATTELKRHARLVAPLTNNEDAVAWVIETALKDEFDD